MPVDRTRRFTLPGIQDLNKDQDAALALPLEGQHLIVGGPGTGKSVVALLRTRRLARDQRRYQALVYNRLLDNSNRHLFGSERPFSAKTWDSWFRDIFKHFCGTLPTQEPAHPGGYRPIDWERVEQLVQSLGNLEVQRDKYLVIDEGQDMPAAFYQILINLGFENFYVAADQNQQLHPDRCSSRQDIEDVLGLESEKTLELTINYRNTRPIAALAQHFYPGDPASPLPKLPQPTPGATTPELWTYGAPSGPSLHQMAERILQLSDRNPRKLIGIITPNNKVREKFLAALHGANPRLDHGRPPIQTYAAGHRQILNFGHGGIMVINAQSCKGLEFELVILADIDKHQPKSDPHILKARFYVMVARAREQVFLLRTGPACPVIESLLPTDPGILVRR